MYTIYMSALDQPSSGEVMEPESHMELREGEGLRSENLRPGLGRKRCIVPLNYVDRLWGIWGSYYNTPKAMFYLLKIVRPS